MTTPPAHKPSFLQKIDEHGLCLDRQKLTTLQLNLGRQCNQACHHCHVEAGPNRTESMDDRTANRILELLEQSKTIQTVDITGGAPELNPQFKTLVKKARSLGKNVIDRCNLTIFFEPNQEHLAEFLASQKVHVVASLPCYSASNVDDQRGQGVFSKSIKALQMLNELGYGKADKALKLDLVYNPTGSFLPPAQKELQNEYKTKLKQDFGIEFHQLFTITNMPIKRFLNDLRRSNKLEAYQQLLIDSFNPSAAKEVMCRDLVSVEWQGQLFDCDFNQMLEIAPLTGPKTIWDLDNFDDLHKESIAFADHCFGCTAGAGSSCGGSLA